MEHSTINNAAICCFFFRRKRKRRQGKKYLVRNILTIGIVENHVVVQFGGARGGQLEDFQCTGGGYNGVC